VVEAAPYSCAPLGGFAMGARERDEEEGKRIGGRRRGLGGEARGRVHIAGR